MISAENVDSKSVYWPNKEVSSYKPGFVSNCQRSVVKGEQKSQTNPLIMSLLFVLTYSVDGTIFCLEPSTDYRLRRELSIRMHA